MRENYNSSMKFGTVNDNDNNNERRVSNDIPPVPNFVRMNIPNGQNRNYFQTENQHHSQRERTSGSRNANNGAKERNNQQNGDNVPKKKTGFDILKMLNLKNLNMDNDILIIMALLFLLSSSETDELLMLALLYIII